MSVKLIPARGEMLGSAGEGVRKVAHVTLGVATTLADVVIGDTNVYQLFDVSEPIVVFNCWTQVEEAFTTSVTITIGDTASAARFNSDTTINPAATGAVLVTGSGLSVPYVMSTPIDINADVNGATAAAGLLHIYLEYAVLSD
jgi:hypothetical protein